jgi:hypothetical protein
VNVRASPTASVAVESVPNVIDGLDEVPLIAVVVGLVAGTALLPPDEPQPVAIRASANPPQRPRTMRAVSKVHPL